jgi:hypothetical protein
MRRRDRVVLGTTLMVIGATVGVTWLFGHKAEKLPFWPVWVCVAMFVVGVLFVASAARAEIEPGHVAVLQAVTGRLLDVANGSDGDPFRSTHERDNYQAHHRQVVERESAVKGTVAAEAGAWEELTVAVATAAQARFPQAEFWFPGAIVERSLQLFLGSDDPRLEVGEHALTISRGMADGRQLPPSIAWSQLVVWTPLMASADANATDQDVGVKIEDVRAWLRGVRDSEVARVYREAVLNTRARRNELRRAGERLTGRAVGRKWGCTDCHPIRGWELWR